MRCSGHRRCRWLAAVGLAALIAPAGIAAAGELEANLTTLVSGRQDPRDDEVHTVVPMFELISLRATDVSNPWVDDLRLVVGGWVRLDPGEPADDDLGTGDVDVAYLQGTMLDRRLRLRFGRQLVFGGGARGLQYDGLDVEYRAWRKLHVEAYGGNPVTPRFVIDRGDAVAGSRVSWRQSADSELGLSFIHLRDDGVPTRQDLGIDGRYKVRKDVVATGHALWSTLENRPVELNAGVQWQAKRTLQVAGDYRLTSPDLFLPRGSILSVFAQDRRQEVGARAALRPRPRLRFDLETYYINIEEGSGARARARAMLVVDRDFRTRIGSELRLLHTPSNGYHQGRVYATHRASDALQLGLDADVYHFEESINDFDWSFTSTANATYSIKSTWHATVVGLAGVTPFLEQRFEIMAKLTYGHVREVRSELP